jgi:N-acyl-D-amino-acid deacylase
LIRRGFVIDGTGSNSEPRQIDIGIEGDCIKAVGDFTGAYAENVIEAKGLFVCPGFIDTHSHSEFTLLADSRAEGKIYQGVTTEINGNCGMSAAPLYGEALEQREEELKSLHIKERWNSFKEYFDILHSRRLSINFVTLVGHGNLRSSVAGYSNRALDVDERKRMNGFLRDAIESGAIGLSTGLAYPPGIYSDTLEIIELTKETLKYGGHIYTTHLRDEGDMLLEAIDEVIRIGLDSRINVHISHLKTEGSRNWWKIRDIVKRLYEANGKGLNLTCDRYPYTAAATDLDIILPSWCYEGGHRKELERIRVERKKIIDELLKNSDTKFWERIKISSVGSDKNKWMEGRSLTDIAAHLRLSPVECLLDLLLEEKLKVGAIFFCMSEDNLKTILRLPYTMIGSDSSARCLDGITAKGKPHPRGFGSFPRILGRYVRQEGVLSLMEAVYKMTGLPAKTFGIKRRGEITEGFFADIIIFDGDIIIDNATYDNPFKKPEGIYYVFVNGVPVLWEGRLTGAFPGRILKNEG